MPDRKGATAGFGPAAWAAALLAGSTALAQSPTPRPTPFSEKVEVNVRTVLVRITGPDGKPPSPPPGPEDIEVREDGAPARVIGVDPARSAPAAAPTPPPGTPPGAKPETAPPPAAPAPAAIPQHLYLDTTLLEPGSVTRLASLFEKNLDAILSNGPLEIVVADPQPRQTLESTRDPAAVRTSLQELSRKVAGKQSLILVRRQTVDTLRGGMCVNFEAQSRLAAEQELRLIGDSLDRLLTWAASLGGQRPDVVYYVTDGFDSDVSETYRRVILESTSSFAMCLQAATPEQMATNLQQEFTARSNGLVGLAARSLASLGVEAVPLALGGNLNDTGGDASVSGHDAFRSRAGTIPLFARPLEPLRTISEATGGEVVTSPSQLPAMLDALGNAYVVSFRSAVAGSGKTLTLAIASRRPGLTVRAPTALAEGPPESVGRGQAVRALHEAPSTGGFPLRLAIDGVRKSGKQYDGVLHVDADISSLRTSLEALGGGRLRLTIAVDVEGAREPFTTNQEFDIAKDQANFGADVPITWPKKTRKIAVTVEELRTGARSTAAADVPRPD